MSFLRHLNSCSSRRTLLALALALPWLAAALPADAAERPTLLATTQQVADIVRNVAGETAVVEGLLGEGVDPHLYKLTRADVARLTTADAVFYNGLLLEGKMTDALIRIANAGTPVVAVTERLAETELLAPEAFEGQYDPHVWMDVRSWIAAVGVVEAALAKMLPERAQEIADNAAGYRMRLSLVDDYARQVLESVPAERRVLVTAHDAFNYFGRAYGFDVMGIQGLSTESEAGLQRIEALVATLVERRIPAVFVETTVADRNIQALVEGAAAVGHRVVIGGSLFSDAMGPADSWEGTYVGMIDHNVSTIARALGGTVPDGGFRVWVEGPQD